MTSSKTDYNYKSYILKNYSSLLNAQRKASMFSYSKGLYELYGVINYTMKKHLQGGFAETLQELNKYCKDTKLENEYKECVKINHAFYERTKRLRERVANIITSGESSFITLTFTNDVFANTTCETRRRYVARFLKTYNARYVANVDYGKTTEREHYHCVLGCIPTTKRWDYGFMDIEPIETQNENDVVALSKYVAKLTNHAIKETTKRCCLLYSRS